MSNEIDFNVKENPWRQVIVDALIVNHIYNAKHDNDPLRALADLLQWEISIALDPAVSSAAQRLINESGHIRRAMYCGGCGSTRIITCQHIHCKECNGDYYGDIKQPLGEGKRFDSPFSNGNGNGNGESAIPGREVPPCNGARDEGAAEDEAGADTSDASHSAID